jgi:hypothetical protein
MSPASHCFGPLAPIPVRPPTRGILVLLFALVFLTGGCVRLDEHGFDDAKLKDDIKQGKPIEIANYTPFAWDRFYVYVHTDSRDAIKAEVGQSIPFPHRESQSHCLLVFMSGGKPVAAFEEPRGSIDFFQVYLKGGYARGEAKFRGTLASDGVYFLQR